MAYFASETLDPSADPLLHAGSAASRGKKVAKGGEFKNRSKSRRHCNARVSDPCPNRFSPSLSLFMHGTGPHAFE